MDSPRAVLERQLRLFAKNRLLADGQWQYQGPAYLKEVEKAMVMPARCGHLTASYTDP
jgi:hypothetical protein